MRDLDNIYSCKHLKNELTYFNQENNPSHDIGNMSIVIVTRKRLKNRKKQNVLIHTRASSLSSRLSISKEQGASTRHSSMPELNECTKLAPPRKRSERGKDSIQNIYKQNHFHSKFIVNVVSEHRFDERSNPFKYQRPTKFKIYRCEVGGAEDYCCCSCNSDAMFEIMRSLYECYKKKDCRNCTCILCSHLKPEEKQFSEKEKHLRELAMKGLPLPEGKTASEIKLINKVRTDLGAPIEPTTKAIRDKHEQAAKAGKLLPLEGKMLAEKEKILQDLYDMGIPLPKGRTKSEKALIAKITGKTPSEAVSEATAPSEQMRRAKAEGLLTPLKGKTPEEREKILKRLAMKGLPLPEGQTPSENKLIKKVRADLGLPIEPRTKSIRNKHEEAAKAGKLLPLEGKTHAQKEKILKGLHDMGIPLPVGRTPSEKALIAKIAASPRAPPMEALSTLSPSERMRRAKAEGLLTTLKGKTPEEREKILKGLAMKGLPLPEGQTPSENKLIEKVRTNLGLPIEPKTKAIRDLHEKAAKAGKLLPLEGKTAAQKEKILKGLHDMDIPLPVGRTPSEKALIAKIAASPRDLRKVASATLSPSELMRRAKAEGLLTTLKGKTPKEREKILRGLAMTGLPLPEGQTPSENKLIVKVRTDLGVPIEPKTKAIRDLHEKAAKAGKLLPLEGKTAAQKEKILKGLHDMDIPLPVGRTPSEKALIAKIAASPRDLRKVASATLSPSELMRRAKAEGLLTTLKGKTPKEREKILRGLAMSGLPLPEGQTPSENKLIEKVRTDLGVPIEPKTKAIRDLHEKAAKAGKLLPLEGKTAAQKEKILKGLHDMDIPLPVGRTPSEKALITKIKKSPRSAFSLSEQLRKAKAEGLLTPLKGKPPEQKEKILKGLAMKGLPLPEAQSPSEKKLIDKVRADLGLPKDPTTKSMKEKHELAAKAGLLQPLEGKTPAEKEKILKGLRDMGIPLPEGRTPSEKAIIAKVKASPRSAFSPSEQLRKAKAEGLLTPLKGKTPEQKAKILKGLAMKGLPLPEAQSPSEKKLINKMRADLGLPKDPTTKSMKEKHELAAKAGLLQPLEGKTPAEKTKILKGLRDIGIPLPEGRTPSEKALIANVKASPRSAFSPSEQLRQAKAEGLLTPLKGKPPEQKEKILKGLAMKGLPLPEAQSPSEKKLIDKVRADLGLPKDPTTKSMKEKHELAAKAGLLQPLEGKTPAEKAKILKGLRDIGIPLPEGRTPSEKALIANVKASPRSAFSPSEQLRKAKAEGLLTPLKGKPPEQKEKILKGLAMKGLPLPEAQSPSEKKLIDKVRADLGLPKDPTTKSMKEKHELAAKAGLLQPLEGKTPTEKAKILKGLRDMGIPLPEGRTPSEKALIAKVKTISRSGFSPSEQLRKAKAEGLLTPLKGKAPEQKEKILKGLAMKGLPLPEAQSPSEKKLIEKVRTELGLPKEPTTKSMREKHEQAAKAGLLQPLEGKTSAEKERTLKGLHDLGIPLPEGRTPSEKALIAIVKASPRSTFSPTEQLRKAKAEGLLTPLKGKPPEQKEKILKGLAMKGLPLPEAQSPSEKKLIDKVRADLGLPKDPTTKSMKEKHYQAAKAGLLQPLEGKTPAEKAKILKGLRDMGIPLPEGRTPSEKALIAKVKATSRSGFSPSEQLRKAKAEGLLTPLKGKTPEEREKILRGLAMIGLPLPEGQTPSENKLIEKVRTDLGVPIEPKTKAIRDLHKKAAKAGKLLPLEGKTPAQKEKILKGLHDMDIPLPVGRTPSEKALIAKIKKLPRAAFSPSEQLRKAKAEGLLTTLKGKTPEEKEKILRGLAMLGLPLPEGQTPSENKLIEKVRTDLGVPIEPKTKAIRDLHKKAAKAGKLLPLEGKTPAQKEKILKGLHDMDIPLPVGRTPSEKALIAKIKKLPRAAFSPTEQLRKAKAEGLLTTLKGKTPEEKEKILRGLAMIGLPLPEGQTPSENKLIEKVRTDLGVPIEPKTKAIRDLHKKAAKAGKLLPLEGKTPAQKEKILKGLHDMDIPLPVGRTPSEKALIAKIKKLPRAAFSPTEQLRKAKAEGLLTTLKGKTPEEKEKILRGLAMLGLPLPEGQTPSENKLIEKVRTDLGVPIEPKTKAIRDLHKKAAKAGKLLPLEGKTPAQKEKILKGLHDMDIPLPVGRTPSEKALLAKIKKLPRAAFSPSEQLRKAKAEGLLTTLKGKTPEEKEKILRGLAMIGLPLPEGQTPSENKLIEKVRTDLGVPIEPKTKAIRDLHKKAAKAGKLLPLEGKTPAQKEKILKGLHDMDIPLPVGRTPSEKALIAKIKKLPRAAFSPTEQLRKAKAEGLLTTLKGKTPEEREKILRGLAMIGLPLPEGQTPSENKLIKKVRTDLGVPIEPKTKAIRDLHEKAAKAGKLLPLEGKTAAQKEKILKGLHDMDIPLPVGRTPSEKALIAKIAASPRDLRKVAPATLSPSELMRRAKAEGLLTTLKGKTPEEREKILKGLAMIGLPLPEGQTPSENKLIEMVRTDLGVPIEPKTKAIRDLHEKAAKSGKLLPLEGKTHAQKEKILKDLHDMGIPLPVGRTPSEKALIAKIMASIAEKGEGVAESKKQAAGMTEQYEEIVKTTKCDRACGCDKKKIRFKHSYVKIKVTSPDISSFCDCRDECFPRVKSGVFVDGDGIKVTVGCVVGVPSFTAGYKKHKTFKKISSKTNYSYSHTRIKSESLKNSIDSKCKELNLKSGLRSNKVNSILNIFSNIESSSTRLYNTESENIYQRSSTALESETSKSDKTKGSFRRFQPLGDRGKKGLCSKTKSTVGSTGSILVLKSEMSLNSTISNKTMDIISLTSVMDSSITSSTTHFSGYHSTDDPRSSSSLEELLPSDDLIDHPATIGGRKKLSNFGAVYPKREYTIMTVSQTKLDFLNNKMITNKLNSEEDPVLLNYNLQSKLDMTKIMNKILSNKRFAGASSIFIVIPLSEDEEEQGSSNCVDSKTSTHLSKTESILKDTSQVDPNPALRPTSFTKLDGQLCGKAKKFYLKEKSSSNDTDTMFQNESIQVLRRVEMMIDEFRQIRGPNEIHVAVMLEKSVQSCEAETSTNTSCCCYLEERSDLSCSSGGRYSAKVTSGHKTPLFMKGRMCGCGLNPDMYTTSEVSSVPPFQSMAPDATTNTLCHCYLKERSDPNCSSGVHYSAKVTSGQETPFCLQDGTSGHFGFQGMHRQSLVTAVMQYDFSIAFPSVGTSQFSGVCSLSPDMYTTSQVYTVPFQSVAADATTNTSCYCNLKERSDLNYCSGGHYSANVTSEQETPLCLQGKTSSSSSRLPGLHSISAISLVQRHISCAMKSSISPSITTSYYRLPDMKSFTVSSILQCKVPSATGVDWSSSFPSQLYGGCSSLILKTPTELSEHLSDIFTCSDSYVSMAEIQGHPAHFRNNMHKHHEPNHPSTQRLFKETSMSRGDLYFSSKVRKPRNESTTSSMKADYSKAKTISRQNRLELLSHTIKTRVSASHHILKTSFKTTGQSQHLASQQSYLATNSADEEDCSCKDKEGTNITDQISIRKPRLQASRKFIIPIYSTNEEYSPCEDKESTDITYQISGWKPRPQTSWKIKMAVDSSDEDNDIESTDIIPDTIPSRKPQLLTSGKSKIPITSTYEEDCPCEDMEGRDITGQISSPKRHVQASRNVKMTIDSSDQDEGTETIPSWIPRHGMSKKSINSASEEDFPCDDIESADITDQISNEKSLSIDSASKEYFPYDDVEGRDSITDEILTRKPRLQASRHSKMSIDSTYEEFYPGDDIEGTDSKSDEISSRKSRFQTSRKSKISIEAIDIIPEKISKQFQSSQKSKMPTDENNLCKDIDGRDITEQISSRMSQIPSNSKSKISIYSDDKEDYPFEDIEETDIIPTTTIGGKSIRKSWHQSSQKSKMPLDSANGYHYQCENIEGTNELSSRQPPRQAIQKSKKLKDLAIKDDCSCCHSRPKYKMPINSTDEEDCSCEDIDIITVEISNQRQRFRASRKSKILIYFTDEADCPCEDMGIDITDRTSSRKPRLQADLKSKTPIYSTDEEDCPCEDRKGTDITDLTSSPKPLLQVSRKIKITIDTSDEDNDIQGTDIITDTIPSHLHRLQAGGKSKMPLDSSYEYPCLCEDEEGTNTIPSRKPHFQASQKSKKHLNSTIKADFENKGVEHSGIIPNELRSQHLPPHVRRDSKMPLDSSYGYPCLCEDEEGANTISSQKPHFQASQKSIKLSNFTIKGDFENKGVEDPGITEELKSSQMSRESTQKKKTIKEVYQNQQQSKDINNNAVCVSEEIEERSRVCLTDQVYQQERASTKDYATKVNCECQHLSKDFRNKVNCECQHLSKDFRNNVNYESQHLSKYAVCVCEEIEERSRVCLTDQVHQQERASTKDYATKVNCECQHLSKGFRNKVNCECQHMSKDFRNNVNYECQRLSKDAVCVCEEIEERNRVYLTDQVHQQKRASTKDYATKVNCECQHLSKDFRNKVNCECQHLSKDFRNNVNYECQHLSKDAVCVCEEIEERNKVCLTDQVHQQKRASTKDYATKVNCECQHLSKGFRNKVNYECQHLSKDAVCVCEEIEERSRVCLTDQVQHQERASTKNSKITKLISSIKKSLSHKIDKSLFRGTSKMARNSKPQSPYIVQTMPEQATQTQEVHQSQQIPLDATSVPSVCVYDGYPYEYSCGWIDIIKLMRLRSKLTETTSGFKTCIKRKKYIKTNEIELDFEDAIKYYVGKNLEQFQDLIPPIESVHKKAKVANKNKIKQKNKKFEDSFTSKDFCGCPYESVPPAITYDSLKFTPETSAELAKLYPKGLKFSLGGTGLIPAPAGHNAAEAPARTVTAPCCYANVQL